MRSHSSEDPTELYSYISRAYNEDPLWLGLELEEIITCLGMFNAFHSFREHRCASTGYQNMLSCDSLISTLHYLLIHELRSAFDQIDPSIINMARIDAIKSFDVCIS